MGARTLNLFKPHPCSEHAVYWTDDYAAVPFDVTTKVTSASTSP